FIPETDFVGTISSAISFRAWDQTQSETPIMQFKTGRRADTSVNGENSAFSADVASAGLTVTAFSGPSVVLSTDTVEFSENGGTAEIKATLSAPAAEDVVIYLKFTGNASETDFTAVPQITIPGGSTEGSTTLTAIADNLDEGPESIVARIDSIAGPVSAGDVVEIAATITEVSAVPGDIDGDTDFDANDSFLIHLIKLGGTDAHITLSKGGTTLTAAQIRAAAESLTTAGDVDGDSDFDGNDSFLIHLVKLGGTDAHIALSKGGSSLTAEAIRSRVNGLGGGTAASASQVQPLMSAPAAQQPTSVTESPVFAPLAGNSNSASITFKAGDEGLPDPAILTTVAAGNAADAVPDSPWTEHLFRSWIDTL
ncbi:MAG: hypothetical protein KDA89_24780, partial [Planctomycetaceae bacterium]|nr:hypothetical protein [Planctomycetaceae bacterium]